MGVTHGRKAEKSKRQEIVSNSRNKDTIFHLNQEELGYDGMALELIKERVITLFENEY